MDTGTECGSSAGGAAMTLIVGLPFPGVMVPAADTCVTDTEDSSGSFKRPGKVVKVRGGWVAYTGSQATLIQRSTNSAGSEFRT